MPWKGEKDPYKIWLSEIILQQTRVEQGMAYYNKFVKTYPTVQDLAAADEKKVFKLWEGLGYYSRCRNLLATAKLITADYGGDFPATFVEIQKLKGVGPYTAAAIASFAFHLPHAVVDGNVLRILARVFGISDTIDSTAGKKRFTQLADSLLDADHPAAYNQAIMDFGATVCKPAQPLCTTCCFRNGCIAFLENKVSELPLKEKKIKLRERFFYFFIIKHKNSIAVRERTENDIWRHLHSFPVVELDERALQEQAITAARQKAWIKDDQVVKITPHSYMQKLTHQKINAWFLEITVSHKPTALKDYSWISEADLPAVSFPKIINDYLSTPAVR